MTFKGFISQFGRDSLEPGWHDFEKLSDRPVRARQAGHNEDGRQQLETPCLTHRPCWRRPQSSWGPQRGPSSPLATASQLGWKRSAAGAQIFSQQKQAGRYQPVQVCRNPPQLSRLPVFVNINNKMEVSFMESKGL